MDSLPEIERAASLFEQGFSCSQSVFSAYAEQFGLDGELALRVSGAFGSGMGRLGATCGAVTGAFMVIGLKYAKTKPEDDESKERTYALVQQFAERFRERNGSTVCRELLGYDLSTPEGRQQVEEQGISQTLCPGLVRSAVEILHDILG